MRVKCHFWARCNWCLGYMQYVWGLCSNSGVMLGHELNHEVKSGEWSMREVRAKCLRMGICIYKYTIDARSIDGYNMHPRERKKKLTT